MRVLRAMDHSRARQETKNQVNMLQNATIAEIINLANETNVKGRLRLKRKLLKLQNQEGIPESRKDRGLEVPLEKKMRKNRLSRQ